MRRMQWQSWQHICNMQLYDQSEVDNSITAESCLYNGKYSLLISTKRKDYDKIKKILKSSLICKKFHCFRKIMFLIFLFLREEEEPFIWIIKTLPTPILILLSPPHGRHGSWREGRWPRTGPQSGYLESKLTSSGFHYEDFISRDGPHVQNSRAGCWSRFCEVMRPNEYLLETRRPPNGEWRSYGGGSGVDTEEFYPDIVHHRAGTQNIVTVKSQCFHLNIRFQPEPWRIFPITSRTAF